MTKSTLTSPLSLKMVLLMALMLLVACAPTEQFVNSTASNAARVEIKMDKMRAQAWTLYSFDNGETCQGRRVVASSTVPSSSEVRVEPNRRHSYMLSLHHAGLMCRIAMSFEAKPGHIYGVEARWDGERCYMSTLNTTRMIQGEKEPTTVRRHFKTAFSESDSWCMPIDLASVGQAVEAGSTTNPEGRQLPRLPDGTRQPSTSLNDLKDLLPSDKK